MTAAMTPTAKAKRPPCTFKPLGALLLESGAAVVWEAAVLDALDLELEAKVLLADPVLLLALESVVVADELSVVSEDDAVREPVLVLPVAEAVPADPVEVPVAPVMPKLGEKLRLSGLLSSMISSVYKCELTSAPSGIWRVALPMEAGIPARRCQINDIQ